MKNQQKEQQSECSLGKNTCRQGTLWGHSLSLKDSQTRCMGISCQKVSLHRFLCEGVDTQTQQHCVAIPVGGGRGRAGLGKSNWLKLDLSAPSRTWNPVTARETQELFATQQNLCFAAGHTSQRIVPIAVRSEKNVHAWNKGNKTGMVADLLKSDIHISAPQSVGRKKRHCHSSQSQEQNES